MYTDHCTSYQHNKRKSTMSLYNKLQPVSSTHPLIKRASPATQTLLSLILGSKIPLGLVLQGLTPQVMKREEERREKVKQAKKEEKERQEKRAKETAAFKKFINELRYSSRSY